MSWSVWGDWGTTRLRLFRIEEGQVADRIEGCGIGQLADSAADELRRGLAQWADHGAPAAITLIGMAGARIGLAEAPYLPCPADAQDWAQGALRLNLDGVPVRIGPGMRMASRDVMRGEEAQVFGALARRPDLAQGRRIFILPGTHSKWVEVLDGRIREFRTYFTGELYGRLIGSTLVAAVEVDMDGPDARQGWAEGLALARRNEGLLHGLFGARAAQLLQGRTPAWAQGFLSGLLIGGEIGESERANLLPQQATVIGGPGIARRYEEALAASGVAVDRLDGDDCALAGLELLAC
jgi:2-dehydro-3-deoxygalactonokinase